MVAILWATAQCRQVELRKINQFGQRVAGNLVKSLGLQTVNLVKPEEASHPAASAGKTIDRTSLAVSRVISMFTLVMNSPCLVIQLLASPVASLVRKKSWRHPLAAGILVAE